MSLFAWSYLFPKWPWRLLRPRSTRDPTDDIQMSERISAATTSCNGYGQINDTFRNPKYVQWLIPLWHSPWNSNHNSLFLSMGALRHSAASQLLCMRSEYKIQLCLICIANHFQWASAQSVNWIQLHRALNWRHWPVEQFEIIEIGMTGKRSGSWQQWTSVKEAKVKLKEK